MAGHRARDRGVTALTEPSAGSVASSLRSTTAGWRLPALLVTKAIASGMFMLMAATWILGLAPFDRRTALVGNGVALVFLAITTVLLVADLERPERFLRILTRPQWKSWLTRGAFILIGFSLVCTAWFALELGARLGWVPEGVAEAARVPLMLLGFPLALLTAIYTAFLFQQCEGRDLWQSRLMPWHMGVQAVMAGGAALGAALLLFQLHLPAWSHLGLLVVWSTFSLAGALDLALRWTEVTMRHNTSNGSQAAWILRNGPERLTWRASMLIGGFAVLAPVTYGAIALNWFYGQLGDSVDPETLALLNPQFSALISNWLSLWPLAGILALVGLFLYESAIIKAGQDVPNA